MWNTKLMKETNYSISELKIVIQAVGHIANHFKFCKAVSHIAMGHVYVRGFKLKGK